MFQTWLVVLACAGWPMFLFLHYRFARRRDLLTALVSMILPLIGLFILLVVVGSQPSPLLLPEPASIGLIALFFVAPYGLLGRLAIRSCKRDSRSGR
jgi:hypothetical protein